MPIRASCIAITSLAFVIGTLGAAGQPFSDPPTHLVEAPNFKGMNVCMTVMKPDMPGIDRSQIPSPVVRMEVKMGRQDGDYPRDASYVISVAELGSLSVNEEVALDDRCTHLPLDRFDWRDDPDGQRANANFCLTRANDPRKVHVRVSAQAARQWRSSLKSVLVGMSACQMNRFPSHFYSEDKYSAGDSLLMGPYVLAR